MQRNCRGLLPYYKTSTEAAENINRKQETLSETDSIVEEEEVGDELPNNTDYFEETLL